MSAEIIEPNFVTTLDVPPERVLRRAMEADLEKVVVIGWDKEGEEYFASSVADGGDVLWMLERAKINLLRIVEDE